MPELDLGVPFSDVENSDTFDPMPAATYEFQVMSGEQTTTAEDRPMIKWILAIINNEEFKGRQLFYNTPLPWNNPATGQRDIGGIGLLVGLCKGVGHMWEGNTFAPEPVIGLTGQVEVKQRQKKEKNAEGKYVATDEIVNEVKKFVY